MCDGAGFDACQGRVHRSSAVGLTRDRGPSPVSTTTALMMSVARICFRMRPLRLAPQAPSHVRRDGWRASSRGATSSGISGRNARSRRESAAHAHAGIGERAQRVQSSMRSRLWGRRRHTTMPRCSTLSMSSLPSAPVRVAASRPPWCGTLGCGQKRILLRPEARPACRTCAGQVTGAEELRW
jgi:hypothetical protein